MFESGIELKLADCLFCLNIRKRDMEANGWICWKQGFGPGVAGSAFGLARLISKEFGVLEPMQSKYTIEEGFGEKDESLRRLGEICDRADGYQEEKYVLFSELEG